MTRTSALLLTLPALLLVATTGCADGGPAGGSRSGSTGDAAGPAAGPDPDAIRSGLASLVTDGHATSAATADGTCFADALLDRTSPQELRDAGVLDPSYAVVGKVPQLPEALAQAWVTAQFACTDFVEQSARAQAAISHGRVDADAYAACLHGALPAAELRAAVVDTLTGTWDGPALGRFSAAQAACSRQSLR